MMSNELGNYSLDEINTNKDVFKRALIFYSANVKNYAKWFEINEINKNETSFTSYKVIYRVSSLKKFTVFYLITQNLLGTFKNKIDVLSQKMFSPMQL